MRRNFAFPPWSPIRGERNSGRAALFQNMPNAFGMATKGSTLDTFKSVADKVSRRVAAYMLLALIATVALQVVARQMLKISTPWTEELSKDLLIWATFCGSISLFVRYEHLMVDILCSMYSPLCRQLLRVGVEAISLIVSGSLALFGYKLCTHRMVWDTITAGLEISRVWMYVLLPISMGVIAVIVFYNLCQALRDLVTGSYRAANRPPEGEDPA